MPRATPSKAGSAGKTFDIDAVVARLRAALPTQAVSERKMFGGVYFMVNGNMTIGASRRGMLVRVGKEKQDEAVRLGARPADMKGRPMEGYVRVDPVGLSDAALTAWVGRAVTFARTLPPKIAAAKPGRPRPRKRK